MRADIIADYFAEMGRIIHALPRQQISQIVELLFETWQGGGTAYIMGNGGSASTATHFAGDLSKSTIVPGKRRFRAMALVDNIPLVSAWTNDSGFASIFAEQLEAWLEDGDVLIGLSVHGGSGEGEAGPWSQNMLQAVALAKERKAKVIGFSGFDGGAMKELSDICVVIPVSMEPLGTPLVESFHVALHHLVCTALRQRIDEANN